MRAFKKPVSVLLAVIMAFSAVSISAAADETEISAGEPAVTEERDPFIPKPEDCWVGLDRYEAVKGESVNITAFGSYIDTFTQGVLVTPVEGDVRMIPVKWTAKQVDSDRDVGSGEWTNEATVETATVDTLLLIFTTIDAIVTVRVEVEFVIQQYENGSWNTTGTFTDSNIFYAATSAEYFKFVSYNPWIGSIGSPDIDWANWRSVIAFIKSIDWAGGRFSIAYVARAVNIFFNTHFTSGSSFFEIIRATLEIFS